MAAKTRSGVAATRSADLAAGERLAGFIYGTIVVLSVIVGGARAFPHSPGRIAALATATCAVFWLAHVYATGLGHSLARGERLSLVELRHIARREASIIEAAVPSVGVLVLGALGVFSEPVAVWLAFGLGLGVLAEQGLVFARAERLGWAGTIAVVAANLGLGLVLVALKLLLGH